MNFPSVRGGQGLSKGRRGLAWGVGGGLGAGVRGGLDSQGTDRTDIRTFVCLFARSDGRTDGKFTPLFYKTSSPSGPLPKRGLRESQRGLKAR